jgi:hypothetical protein
VANDMTVVRDCAAIPNLAATGSDSSLTTRRGFFHRVADGALGAALLYLFNRDIYGGSGLLADEGAPNRGSAVPSFDLRPRPSHFRPKATSVIQLFMQGGPSQVDLFDPKPLLDRYHGRPASREILNSLDDTRVGGLMRSPFRFARRGKSGLWLSELLPNLGREADDIAVIRSMFSTHQNHEPACYMIQSGRMLSGLPALGAWVVYGLGTVNQNLPAYVVLADPLKRLPTNEGQNWQSGFLPPIYQGIRLRSIGSPLLNLRPEWQEPADLARLRRDLLARLDRIHQRERPGQLQLDARIAGYELAARMQLEASEALNISQESRATLDMYGVGQAATDNFARRCVMARRLVERGVRFVQVIPGGQEWDTHGRLAESLPSVCRETDQPVAALLRDLRQRGLLDSTLVLWGGEFGRLPIAQVSANGDMSTAGRDHGPFGFSLWMAGGGVKGGIAYGATDDIGFAAVENRVSVTDWHATILHLLGLHHEQLFFERNGLREKLTSTFQSRLVREILA